MSLGGWIRFDIRSLLGERSDLGREAASFDFEEDDGAELRWWERPVACNPYRLSDAEQAEVEEEERHAAALRRIADVLDLDAYRRGRKR